MTPEELIREEYRDRAEAIVKEVLKDEWRYWDWGRLGITLVLSAVAISALLYYTGPPR